MLLGDLSTAQAGVHPTAIGGNATGPTVDLGANIGNGVCFAIQQVGDLEDEEQAGSYLDGKIQQSANGSAWSDITGATFTRVEVANQIQAIRFTRTMRYVRWAATVGNPGGFFTVAATIGRVTGDTLRTRRG